MIRALSDDNQDFLRRVRACRFRGVQKALKTKREHSGDEPHTWDQKRLNTEMRQAGIARGSRSWHDYEGGKRLIGWVSDSDAYDRLIRWITDYVGV